MFDVTASPAVAAPPSLMPLQVHRRRWRCRLAVGSVAAGSAAVLAAAAAVAAARIAARAADHTAPGASASFVRNAHAGEALLAATELRAAVIARPCCYCCSRR